MKRAIGILVAALAVTAGLVATPVAQGVPNVVVQSGMKYGNLNTANPSDKPYGIKDFCTLGAVGYDGAGNRVAITAGHCSEGATTGWKALTTGGQEIGTYVTSKKEYVVGIFEEGKFDYAFILLNDNVVFADDPATPPNPTSAIAPTSGERLCKFGHAPLFPGERCGRQLGNYNTVDFNALIASFFGDSGGPVYRENDKTKLVGIISRPYNLNSVVVQRVDSASADALADGTIGGGFYPVA